MNSQNKTYQIISDDYGTLSTQIRGNIDIQKELRYHIERCYHYQLMGYDTNHELINHLRENTQKSDIDFFVATTKDELTDTVKILLAALRSLKGVKQSKSNLQNFIGYLDTLINRAKSGSITSGALGIFEGNIENITATTAEENIKAIETNLFNLKNELQTLANILGQLVGTRKEVSVQTNG
jgi:DNA-directed RNA polymerase subunit L